MRPQTDINSFLVLRSSGWSLHRIAQKLNIPKATLFKWDGKHQGTLQVLKFVQLERLQEKFLPTYEEELSRLSTHLARVEAALAARDYSHMTPEFLLQISLQLGNRLARMREQLPLSTPSLDAPAAPLPYTGCVRRELAPSGQTDPGDAPNLVPLPTNSEPQKETFGDENDGGAKMDRSPATTCEAQN